MLAPFALAVATFVPQDAASKAAEPTVAQRIERMKEVLDQRRELLHISGLSLAVVWHDEIVFAGGFGLRDREAKLPSDERTRYGIGSTSKAFTSALCAMLVDEGKLAWDGRPAQYLPWFAFKNPEANAKATLRDLLSHRTGLTRTDIAWGGGSPTREELMRLIAKTEPFKAFRSDWQYNNCMFLVAGEAAAAVAGKPSWDELLAERIFEPLGMTRATSKAAVALADPQLSKRYDWDGEKREFKPVDWMGVDCIAPAGGIYADVLDMAQWLRLHLRRGERDGKPLISGAQHDELWRDDDELQPGYGLGWFVHPADGRDPQAWRGPDGVRHRVVEHGGNLPGYSAEVSFLPDFDLGLVLLCNTSQSQLQEGIQRLVYDALLGEWRERRPWIDGAPLPKEQWEKWLGAFTGGMEGRANNALIEQDGRPVLVIPPGLGQQALTMLTLGWPDADGRCWLREEPESYVTVERGDDGHATALTLVQGYASRRMKAVVARDLSKVPDLTIDDFFAKREEALHGSRAAAWKSVRMTGTMSYPHSGLVGSYVFQARGPETFRIDYDAKPFGWATTRVAGGRASFRASIGTRLDIPAEEVALFPLLNPIVDAGNWLDWTDAIELKRITFVSAAGVPLIAPLLPPVPGGPPQSPQPCYEVVITPPGASPMICYVSARDFRTVMIQGAGAAFPGLPQGLPIAALDDWRMVDGVPLAFRRTLSDPNIGSCILQLDKVEIDVELDAALFTEPAAESESKSGS